MNQKLILLLFFTSPILCMQQENQTRKRLLEHGINEKIVKHLGELDDFDPAPLMPEVSLSPEAQKIIDFKNHKVHILNSEQEELHWQVYEKAIKVYHYPKAFPIELEDEFLDTFYRPALVAALDKKYGVKRRNDLIETLFSAAVLRNKIDAVRFFLSLNVEHSRIRFGFGPKEQSMLELAREMKHQEIEQLLSQNK